MPPGPRPACLSAALLVWTMLGALGAPDPGSPMHCSSYTVGADTHTVCSPGPAAPPGVALRCQDYTVGADGHAECSPVPATRLAPRGGKIAAPPPATTPRCYTYHIGSSSYVECR